MVCHEKIFLNIVENDSYLEKLLKLLSMKDSPTLIQVFRCLHSYGYNLFTLLHTDTSGPLKRDQEKLGSKNKELIKCLSSKWLIFLASESVVHEIGVIIAS